MVVPACTNSTPKATHEFKTVAHPGITSSDIKYNISHSLMLRFNGSRTILSGPARGVMWYAMTSFEDKPIIGYNMEVEHFHHNLTSEQSQEVMSSYFDGSHHDISVHFIEDPSGDSRSSDHHRQEQPILVESDCKAKMTKKVIAL
ncbi:unnamed protein product [Clavelina lepadiformis]|uniref:Uncharacterized protein n=1 Tax=Clavelina lepadiformis TaxID=159417 RepID=A0ABP0G9Z2_CLALP